MKLRVIIHEAEEGGYWAEVPALPGCVSQAETKDGLKKYPGSYHWIPVN